MTEPHVLVLRPPEEAVKNVFTVQMHDFVCRFRHGCIQTVDFIAAVDFEDGDLWFIYCSLVREGGRYRLFPPRPLPANVFQRLRQEALRFVRMGEGRRAR